MPGTGMKILAFYLLNRWLQMCTHRLLAGLAAAYPRPPYEFMLQRHGSGTAVMDQISVSAGELTRIGVTQRLATGPVLLQG